jgi:hypothetical protein
VCEPACERLGFGSWHPGEKRRDPITESRLRRVEHTSAGCRQAKVAAATVVCCGSAHDETVDLELGDELRHGGTGDPGSSGEIGGRDAAGDRA